tara:strand:+ start:317 stop:1204 length:888 start_codon:yes stop_codon:yes gene_type:complete
MENLLDFIGYHDKWHGTVQNFRTPYAYNQNDHLIREIFRRMEITKGVSVEFGAWDGLYNSNTKNLIDEGWYSIQIEPDVPKFQELLHTYSDNPRVKCVNKFINTTDSLFDDVVTPALLPPGRTIDFCSIDIDGLDLEVFETFERNLPSVVCIEGGQMLHPFHPRVPPSVAQNNIQQSLSTMNEVFAKKGYRVICSYQDSFFVKEEFYHLFDVSENLMNLYLDGVAALPKIPWITKKLEEVNLSNSILQTIAAPLSSTIFEFVKTRGTKAHKMAWVDREYASILETIGTLREEESA